MKRLRVIYLAPVLLFVALAGWAIASPIGASPDDDYHLVSTWCGGLNDAYCAPGSSGATRIVPEALVEAPCYAHEPGDSAACLDRVSFDPADTVETKRGNFVGGYPPVYYAVMNLFVGPGIELSIVAMRLFSALLFTAITTALFVLLPRTLRPALVIGWAVTTVPLGLFLIPSNNPSSWAVIGVGASWLALLGYYRSAGRQRVGLAVVFAVAAVMAAGARGDAAAYVGLGILVVAGLEFERSRAFLRASVLPVVVGVVAGILLLTARQTSSGVGGFSAGVSSTAGTGAAEEPVSAVGLLFYNLMEVPSLLAGPFGNWPLGWLDTFMPAVVTFGSLAVFVSAGIIGFGVLDRRKAIAVAVIGAVVVLLPVYVLTRGGDPVGLEVQPRYVLPLIVVLAGLLLLGTRERGVRFSRGQLLLFGLVLAAANAIALHTNLQRYLSGDAGDPNLNDGIEWWWPVAPSPMIVLVVAALAFAGLLGLLGRELVRIPAAAPLPDSLDR